MHGLILARDSLPEQPLIPFPLDVEKSYAEDSKSVTYISLFSANADFMWMLMTLGKVQRQGFGFSCAFPF